MAAPAAPGVFIDKPAADSPDDLNWTTPCMPSRAGDQSVVIKLDRLGRSLEHLIELSNVLERRGVDSGAPWTSAADPPGDPFRGCGGFFGPKPCHSQDPGPPPLPCPIRPGHVTPEGTPT